jgi:hypothetical protein
MIDVAITGLYVQIIGDGLKLHAWSEPQLVALQKQLRRINMTPTVAESLRTGRAASCQMFLTTPGRRFREKYVWGPEKSFWSKMTDPGYLVLRFGPRGWIYQNVVTIATLEQKFPTAVFEPQTQLVEPRKATDAMRDCENTMSRW